MKLLKKEFALCMHPTGYIMLLGAAFVLIPGYPYTVSCFYMGLAIYFIFLTARENHDASYTLTLPVSREEAVRARIWMACCLEIAQLVLIGLMILLKGMIGNKPNPAGLDAGIALIGDCLITYSIFNMIFFPRCYRDINKPGAAFLWASIGVFLWIILVIVATYTVPFFRDVLDQPDPDHLSDKLLFVLGGLALYLSGTALAFRNSAKKFAAVDLHL